MKITLWALTHGLAEETSIVKLCFGRSVVAFSAMVFITLLCATPAFATRTLCLDDDCPDNDGCVDKWGYPMPCPPDDGGGGGDDGGGDDGPCFDKWGNPTDCPDDLCPGGNCCSEQGYGLTSSNIAPAVAEAADCGDGGDCPNPQPCGGCIPDNATWTCNHNEKMASYLDGFAYAQDHIFDFTKTGISQGSGRTGSESIQIRSRVKMVAHYKSGDRMFYDSGWIYADGTTLSDEPVTHHSHDLIVCNKTCNGQNRSTLGDHYAYSIHYPGAGDLGNLFCSTSQSELTTGATGYPQLKITFTAEQEWNNQYIYVTTDDPTVIKKVGGPFNSSIKGTIDFTISGPCSSPSISKSTMTLQKTGEIN